MRFRKFAPQPIMNITDIRADIIEALNDSVTDLVLVSESADNDNVIIVTDCHGDRYKLTIEKL